MYRNGVFGLLKAGSYVTLSILLLALFGLAIISECSNHGGQGITLEDYPIIQKFEPRECEIKRGEVTELEWVVEGYEGDMVSIVHIDEDEKFDLEDSKSFDPTVDTTYYLLASRKTGPNSDTSIGTLCKATVKVSDFTPVGTSSSPIKILDIKSVKNLGEGFEIINVEDGEGVAQNINLVGEYPTNFDDDIWLFVVAPNGYYYPQSMNASDDTWRTPKVNGKWEMLVGLGMLDEVDEFFDIVLAVTDADTSQVISNFLKDWWGSDYYPGWSSLPSDVSEVKRITVIRIKDRWGPAPDISNADLSGNVSFINIEDGDSVPWRINVLGNCSPDLEEDIWLLLYAPSGRWYPQSLDPCRGTHVQKSGQMWEVPAYFGGENANIGEAFDVVAVLANDTASEFFDTTQKEWCDAGDYPGFLTIELPPGIDEKDRARVYRSADRWGPAPEISNAIFTGDVSFTNIVDGDEVFWLTNIAGNCSSNLEGDVWVLVYASNGRWYPQSTDPCNGSHVQMSGQMWEVPAYFGAENITIRETFDVVAVLANDNASEFFNTSQKEWCNAGDFPGFLTIELPSGIDEKDRARVYRSADRWGPAPGISNVDLPGDVYLTNIADGDGVSGRMNILGNSSFDLGGDIWVLVYAPNGRWYPQSVEPCSCIHVQKAGRMWEVPAYFGGDDNIGEAFDIVAVLANDTASEFFNTTQKEWCNKGDYPGFLTAELPPGIDEKDRASVYRDADRFGSAPEISSADLPGEVSLTNVADDDLVPWQKNIDGNCSPDLEGDIWVLVYAPNGRWYPQSTNPCGGVHVRKAGQRWRVLGTFGGYGNVGEAFDVVVVLASDTASEFFDAKQREWCKANNYPGILTVELPPGIDEKDRARVIRI